MYIATTYSTSSMYTQFQPSTTGMHVRTLVMQFVLGIQGYRSEHAFIATQGPVPSTVNDFWRLVWEQNSPSIIMLTNLMEMGKVKCHKYWPGEGNSESYGEIEVTHEEEVELTEYTIRTFSLVKVCVNFAMVMVIR